MIIEGGSRSNSKYFGEEQMDTTRTNETVEAVFADGVPLLKSAPEMLEYFKFLSGGSKVKNFFTHMAFNNKGDRALTPDEELTAYKMAAKKQGLEGQPFFTMRHIEPNGDQHFHTFTLRVGEDGKAVNNDHGERFKLAQSSREIEVAFGLRRMEDVISQRTPEEKLAKNYEIFKGVETGFTVKRVAAYLQQVKFLSGENGSRFANKLEKSPYILARGDKGNFVVVDRARHAHPLGARLNLRAAALDQFMVGVDISALPSVKEARTKQNAAQKNENTAFIREAYKQIPDAQKFIEALTDKGFIVANGDKRGVFHAVDKTGLYVSIERAAKANKNEFFKRMKSVDTKKLPTLDQALTTRKNELAAWKASQPTGKVTNDRAAEYARFARFERFSKFNPAAAKAPLTVFPVPERSNYRKGNGNGAWGNQLLRGDIQGHALLAGTKLQQVSTGGRSHSSRDLTLRAFSFASYAADSKAFSKGKIAYEAAFAEGQREIEAIEQDQSLSDDEKRAAIFAARIRQKAKAKAARKKAAEEAAQLEAAQRRAFEANQSIEPTPT